jgi:hypothetical protein
MARVNGNGDDTSDATDAPELLIELSPRVKEWIKKKTRGYHPRKPSSKTQAEYSASLEYTALERLEVIYNECAGIGKEDAEYLVFRNLGRTSGMFWASLHDFQRSARKDTQGELDTCRRVIETQGVLLSQLQDTTRQYHDFARNAMEMMERVVNKLDNLALTAPQTLAIEADKTGK